MNVNGLAIRSLGLAALFCLPLAIGCGGSTTTASNDPDTATPSPAEPTAGSEATLIANGENSEPAQCVAIFLDSLRKGDERAANAVLTQLARQEIAKTAWVIEPLGTPAGQYKIGRVGFPYPEKNVALVECTWTEPPLGNQPQEVMDIVCEVHQEADGWRISGFGVTIPGTDQAVVLDFEDAASLQATMDAATGQGSPSNDGPAASATVDTQVQLPAYPDGSGQTTNSATQIALPPLDNAPINR